ncbi:CutA1 divalent ion tolerance protein-domain-containing protein [Paraphysoderma sedebokerense]|nr:CutA1 divalent ion tolerance protein-domain-containing protein [Paraphysoderma sedebokerense]
MLLRKLPTLPTLLSLTFHPVITPLLFSSYSTAMSSSTVSSTPAGSGSSLVQQNPDARVVYCTVPNEKAAQEIGSNLVSKKLAACVNIVPKVTSIYYWNDSIQKDEELLLIIKTRGTLIDELSRYIIQTHPYDTPELVSMKIEEGNQRYLNWIHGSTKDAGTVGTESDGRGKGEL